MQKHTFYAKTDDGDTMIVFKCKSSNGTVTETITAIKKAVHDWCGGTASGEEAAAEVEGCFNWGDLSMNIGTETLTTKLRIWGVKKLKSKVVSHLDRCIVDHDEILI